MPTVVSNNTDVHVSETVVKSRERRQTGGSCPQLQASALGFNITAGAFGSGAPANVFLVPASVTGCTGFYAYLATATNISMPSGVTLPVSVTTIAFETPSSVTSVGTARALAQYVTTTSLTLNLSQSGLTSLPADAFASFASTLTTLDLSHSGSLASISPNALRNLGALVNLYLNNCAGLATLGSNWLANDTALQVIRLQSTIIPQIGNSTFAGLTAITYIDISNNPSLTSMGADPFAQMLNLTSSNLKMDSLQILCVPYQVTPQQAPKPVCMGCSPSGTATVFRAGTADTGRS